MNDSHFHSRSMMEVNKHKAQSTPRGQVRGTDEIISSVPRQQSVNSSPNKKGAGRVSFNTPVPHQHQRPGGRANKMNTLSDYEGRRLSLKKPRETKPDDKESNVTPKTSTSWLANVFKDETLEKLKKAELDVLQRFVSTSCWSQFISVSNNVELRTLKFDLGYFRSSPALVLLHGFASGLACWAPCFDALSLRCIVYALDLPGFGRSTRPSFDGSDCYAIEYQFISYLEEWRDSIGLDSFILAGHGFGGYIAGLYAMKHPDRVRHVILVEPWGFNELPLGLAEKHRNKSTFKVQNGPSTSKDYSDKLPFWLKQINNVLNFSDALSLFRTLPTFMSEWLYTKMFLKAPNSEDDNERAVDENRYFWNAPESQHYIYMCNKMKGTGESAFSKLNVLYFWAKNPLICRLSDLDPEVPLSFIYGSQSVVDHKTGYEVYHLRPESFVEVYMVDKAGHNVFIDNPQGFTDVVVSVIDEIEMEMSEVESRRDANRPARTSNADELYWDCEWETLDLGPEIAETENLPDIIVEDYNALPIPGNIDADYHEYEEVYQDLSNPDNYYEEFEVNTNDHTPLMESAHSM